MFELITAVAHVNLKQLRRNFEILTGRSGGVAMVKANAYGHGLLETARALSKSKQLTSFGVASLDEAVLLRAGGIKKPIWVFSRGTPMSKAAALLCKKQNLVPVLSTLEDLKIYLKYNRSGFFHLKINTGMNRLGLDESDWGPAKKLIADHGGRFQGLCTHFAQSGVSGSKLTRIQTANFKKAYEFFKNLKPYFMHASNTCAILDKNIAKELSFCNVVRPGIGMYGYAGTAGERMGIKPALVLKAKVIRTRTLKKGDRVGYDGTFHALNSQKQAVLGIGYGDAVLRSLSNQQIEVYDGKRRIKTRLLGRVSMDMISLSLKTKTGNWITLLGKNSKQGENLATAAGTITYELLTSISSRVPRIY